MNEELRNTDDVANAARFVALNRDTLRYVEQWGWMVYDGGHWTRDKTGAVLGRAMDVVKEIRREAADETDSKRREDLWKWGRASSFEPRLNAMVNLAKPRLGASVEDFDTRPWLLNVHNGTIDLKTGTKRDHDPADMLTRICPVKYDPEARSADWERFVSDIMCGDKDMVAYLQRAIGYTLTGETGEKGLFFCYGPRGDNGKSTFLEAVRAVLGGIDEASYAQAMPAESLLRGHKSSVPTDIARLVGARFVTAVEPQAGEKLDVKLVKQLTGSDTIPARFMRQDFFDLKPVLKLWVAANDRPEVEDSGDAIWGRMFVVPFNAYFPKGHPKRDETLPDKLRAASGAILAWAVQGCLAWQDGGLRPPEKVRQASQDYRDENDPVGRFLRECCVADDDAQMGAKALYDHFSLWYRGDDYESPPGKITFYEALRKKGYTVRNATSNKVTAFGLRLQEAPHNVTPIRAWEPADEDEEELAAGMPF